LIIRAILATPQSLSLTIVLSTLPLVPPSMSAYPPRQLALALDHPESYAREDFFSGPSNEAALALIESWPDWPARAVALAGPEGSGKTHLATIWAVAAGARVVSGRNVGETDLPAALATGALVVEDGAAVEDEKALFHLINLAREEGAFLLFTARAVPSLWPVSLPDLVSRLRALPVVALDKPDDTLLHGVLLKVAADRQLTLDESVVRYLLTHIERSLAAARAAVIALDKEALRQGRPPSRALAAEMFRDGA
jgi:chromosomal replication initiation ATPase DnaA